MASTCASVSPSAAAIIVSVVKAFEAGSVGPFDLRLFLVLAIRHGDGCLDRHNAPFRTKARRSWRLLIDGIAALTSAAEGGT
ncbi:MAG: hypothetical protein AAAC47_05495 [Pararhizobium sp.]